MNINEVKKEKKKLSKLEKFLFLIILSGALHSTVSNDLVTFSIVENSIVISF